MNTTASMFSPNYAPPWANPAEFPEPGEVEESRAKEALFDLWFRLVVYSDAVLRSVHGIGGRACVLDPAWRSYVDFKDWFGEAYGLDALVALDEAHNGVEVGEVEFHALEEPLWVSNPLWNFSPFMLNRASKTIAPDTTILLTAWSKSLLSPTAVPAFKQQKNAQPGNPGKKPKFVVEFAGLGNTCRTLPHRDPFLAKMGYVEAKVEILNWLIDFEFDPRTKAKLTKRRDEWQAFWEKFYDKFRERLDAEEA